MSTNLDRAAAVRNEAVASCRAAGISLADIGRVLILPQPVNVTVGGLDGGTAFLCCIACREEVAATLGVAYPVRPYVVQLECFLCGEWLVSWDQFSGVAS